MQHPVGLRSSVCSLLTVLLVGSCLPLHAQQVFVENYASQLGTLNLTTGAYTPIGATSERIGGFAALGGTLYGLADDDNLYKINTATAALTLVGSTNTPLGPGYSLGQAADGTFYSIFQSNMLYTVNPATAATTLVGNTGVNMNSDPSGDSSGNLYNAQAGYGDGIYELNRTTGAATLLGSSSIGEVVALSDVGNVMYAVNNAGSIYTIDLSNGAATFSSNYDTGTVGDVYAAGVDVSALTTPEPGAFGLLGGLSLGGLALLRRRSRRSSRPTA